MHSGTTRLSFLLALSATLVACASTDTAKSAGDAAKHAERAASPLVGTWVRDGDTPAPDPNNPQFTKLTFTDDGSLAAEYVAAGGALAGVVKKAPKIQTESDTYTLITGNRVKIVEGSNSREYAYDVHDGKLYLTPPSGGQAVTFSKAQTS